jgi:hypothetical protein
VLLPEVSAVAVDRQRLQAEICEEEKEEDDFEDMDNDEEDTTKDDIL